MGIGQRKEIKLIDETPALVDGDWQPASVTILREWADVKRKSGGRSVENGQTKFDKLFEFRFRYRSDITLSPNIKLVYNGNRYLIHSLEKEKEKNFYWILTADTKAID